MGVSLGKSSSSSSSNNGRTWGSCMGHTDDVRTPSGIKFQHHQKRQQGVAQERSCVVPPEVVATVTASAATGGDDRATNRLSWSTRSLRGSVTIFDDLDDPGSLKSPEHTHGHSWNDHDVDDGAIADEDEGNCKACAKKTKATTTTVTAIYRQPAANVVIEEAGFEKDDDEEEDSLVVVIHSAPNDNTTTTKRALFSGQLHPELSSAMTESFESAGSSKADQIHFGQMHPEFATTKNAVQENQGYLTLTSLFFFFFFLKKKKKQNT